MEVLTFLVILSLFPQGQSIDFDITAFGAVGDAKTDDSQAFLNAWAATCGANGPSNLAIPSHKTFLLMPQRFVGKCTASSLQIQINGNLVAPDSREAFGNATLWIVIQQVDFLTVTGTGQLDGQGAVWWPKNCPKDGCTADKSRPTLLTFESCNNLKLTGGWKLVNSARNHIHVDGCNYVCIDQIRISAPGDTPNTNGINIGHSNHISISNLSIASGDDCISLLSDVCDVYISSITCGPGHGISIGSLGVGNSQGFVTQVNVEHCIFDKTQNGVRIKTWQGGSGYAKNISFRHIEMKEVGNPIIIDQYYHDKTNKSSAVAVSGVDFIGIRGTGSKAKVIRLACGLSVPCKAIHLGEVNLTTMAPGKTASTYCLQVDGSPCSSCTQYFHPLLSMKIYSKFAGATFLGA